MGKFSTFFLALCFGGAVAALGFVDLKKYHEQGKSDPNSAEASRIRNFFQESEGQSSEARAQLAPQPQEVTLTSDPTQPAKQEADIVNVFKKLAP